MAKLILQKSAKATPGPHRRRAGSFDALAKLEASEAERVVVAVATEFGLSAPERLCARRRPKHSRVQRKTDRYPGAAKMRMRRVSG